MSALDDLLRAYVAAPTLAEASAALDELAPSDDLPTDILGDCYDELAAAAANDDDHALAAHLERRAIELGCRYPRLSRQMLGSSVRAARAMPRNDTSCYYRSGVLLAAFLERLSEREIDGRLRQDLLISQRLYVSRR